MKIAITGPTAIGKTALISRLRDLSLYNVEWVEEHYFDVAAKADAIVILGKRGTQGYDFEIPFLVLSIPPLSERKEPVDWTKAAWAVLQWYSSLRNRGAWTCGDDEPALGSILRYGRETVKEQEARWEELGDRPVRVRRVLVYEGPASWMRKQLARSLPLGTKELSGPRAAITVYQDEIEEVKDA